MLSEKYKIVPFAHALDLNSAADVPCDSINMKNYHKATMVFMLGTLATASATMTVNSGATDGATTSALTFNYAFGSAAIGGAGNEDVLATWSSAASLVLTHTSYDDFMLVVEINASAMDIANGEEWLTVNFNDPGGATGTIDGIAILEPRYADGQSATALA